MIEIYKKIQVAILSISDLDAIILRANTIEQAMGYSSTLCIDLFIIDIRLIDGNGITFAKKIREDYQLTPIIFQTIIKDSLTELKAYRNTKCRHYIRKPFSIEQAINVIKECIKYSEVLEKNKLIKIDKERPVLEYNLNNIIYIESLYADLAIITYGDTKKVINKEIIKRYSVDDILNILEDSKDLIRCHRSYLINPRKIVCIRYNKGYIELEHTTQRIPISKTYKENLY